MPIEIRVGPPTITISQNRTFMVMARSGEIESGTNQGIYAQDTRFVTCYRLTVNAVPLTLVDSNALDFSTARFHLTNPIIKSGQRTIKAHTLHLTLNRSVTDGINEDIEIVNYAGEDVTFLLQLEVRSDFADLFEVRSGNITMRGGVRSDWNNSERCLRTTYDNQDFHRAFIYRVGSMTGDVAPTYANGRIIFEVALAPNQKWHLSAHISLSCGEQTPQATHSDADPAGAEKQGASHQQSRSDFEQRQAGWRSCCTGLTTSNAVMQRMYQQAVEDMGALRIYDADVSNEAWIPAAGIPWFVTLFGRDSLLAAYQNMTISPGFAYGALKRLAEYQSQERDDWREAQPGKILHEIRFGELAHFHQVPFTPFYATADATILYLIVLSETYRWTGDRNLLTEYRTVAQRCLDWIDHYGDLDGDGFQEYKSFSSYHYENVGWKDAADAVVYADGSLVPQPKGLCELQGYVYDAKTRMAEIFEELGEHKQA